MANFTTTASATGAGTVSTGQPLPANQMIVYSQEIFFNAQAVLMFNAVATQKTELGVNPGLTIQFTRYDDLQRGSDELTENVYMETEAISSSSFQIQVTEHGKAISLTEKSLVASFTDTMRDASKLLGRIYAYNLDSRARDTLLTTSNILRAENRNTRADIIEGDILDTDVLDEVIARLAENKAAKFGGDAYVMFISPRQAKTLMQDPDWQSVQNYASPENRLNGEIGRYNDIRFVRTTMVRRVMKDGKLFSDAHDTGLTVADFSTGVEVDQSIIVGEHALGYAVAEPVNLRDDGVRDLGRERRVGYYEISGFGLVEESHVFVVETAIK